MAHVTLDQARSGMVLASEVTDRRGRLLMPAGREVTDRHLEAFRMWGVPSIEIEGDDDAEASTPDLDPETLALADGRVSELFALAGADHPFLRTLSDIARIRVARELQRLQGGSP